MSIKLSDIQQDIVNCTDRNIIVAAGAGSGKTRTMTERVRRVLNSGADPKSIVVITFTNRAAEELQRRLTDIKKASGCFIGTIHSYANKLLKKTGMDFAIFTEYHQTQFMQALLEKHGHYATISDYNDFVKYDSLVAVGKMSKSEVPEHFSDYKVYHELMCLLGRESSPSYPVTVVTLCKENNIITLDELIELSTEYFNQSKTKLQYLFVDELQDIGVSEYNFLMTLNAENNFFIGDDYQAIYGFKGGDVGIFLSLMNSADWKTFYLTKNYRTAQSILMYANTIINKADDIIKKPVEYGNKNLGKLEFISKSNLDDFLQSLLPTDDWFILTRTNKEMNQVCAILKKVGIEHFSFKQSQMPDSKLDEILANPCIRVLTIHSAKGLECENVALYGKFPVKGTGESDELKVYYVGLTRAKNRCVVFV